MDRPWTRLALLVALFGIVTGNLLRPCDCAREAHTGATPRCCTARIARCADDSARHACCCQGTPVDPSKDEHRGPEGCTICCKPRPPMDESQGAFEVPARAQVAALFVATSPESWTPVVVASVARTGGQPRRTLDPWLLSPEGLAVFLI